jgi:hypothetical protein
MSWTTLLSKIIKFTKDTLINDLRAEWISKRAGSTSGGHPDMFTGFYAVFSEQSVSIHDDGYYRN